MAALIQRCASGPSFAKRCASGPQLLRRCVGECAGCSGNPPSQYTLVLSGISPCPDCFLGPLSRRASISTWPDLSGAFVVQRAGHYPSQPPYSDCWWQTDVIAQPLVIDTYSDSGCTNFMEAFSFTHLRIRITIQAVSGTNRIHVEMWYTDYPSFALVEGCIESGSPFPCDGPIVLDNGYGIIASPPPAHCGPFNACLGRQFSYGGTLTLD